MFPDLDGREDGLHGLGDGEGLFAAEQVVGQPLTDHTLIARPGDDSPDAPLIYPAAFQGL